MVSLKRFYKGFRNIKMGRGGLRETLTRLEIEGASDLRGARGAVFTDKVDNKMGRGVTPCFNEVNYGKVLERNPPASDQP